MGLFDSIRNWFATSKPAPITEPSGSDGVAAPGGYLWRGETNPDLVGHKLWLTISDAITNSIIVAAAARYFLNLIAGTEWEVRPNEKAGADGVKAAEIVRDGLLKAEMGMPWPAIVQKAALYKFYGFSAHEWIIKRRTDGMVVFADIQHRPQYTIHWWDKPDERSPLLGLVQQTRLGSRYYLPRERLFYCVDNSLTDNPDGLGLMRHIIPKAKRLDRYEQLEGIAFETHLRGIPYGRAPISKLQAIAKAEGKGSGWVDKQLDAINTFTESHVRTADLGLVLDSSPYFDKEGHPSAVPQWAIELLTGEGGPLQETAVAINRVNLEIARVIGCEFMMMGGSSGSTGNRAMHEDKTEQFGNMIDTTLGAEARFAKRDLAHTLVGLNGLDADLCTPDLLPGSVATESGLQVCQALLAMAQAGAPLMPGDPAVDQLRARLHLADQPKLTPEIAGMLPPRPTKPGPNGKPAPGGGKDGKPAPDKAPAQQPGDTGDGSVDVDMSDVGDDDASSGLKRKRGARS